MRSLLEELRELELYIPGDVKSKARKTYVTSPGLSVLSFFDRRFDGQGRASRHLVVWTSLSAVAKSLPCLDHRDEATYPHRPQGRAMCGHSGTQLCADFSPVMPRYPTLPDVKATFSKNIKVTKHGLWEEEQ